MLLSSVYDLDVVETRKKFSEFFRVSVAVEKGFFSKSESGFGVKKFDFAVH